MMSSKPYLFSNKKERKKDDSAVATGMQYGVASFSSWSRSVCNLETGIMRIRETLMTTAFFRK